MFGAFQHGNLGRLASSCRGFLFIIPLLVLLNGCESKAEREAREEAERRQSATAVILERAFEVAAAYCSTDNDRFQSARTNLTDAVERSVEVTETTAVLDLVQYVTRAVMGLSRLQSINEEAVKLLASVDFPESCYAGYQLYEPAVHQMNSADPDLVSLLATLNAAETFVPLAGCPQSPAPSLQREIFPCQAASHDMARWASMAVIGGFGGLAEADELFSRWLPAQQKHWDVQRPRVAEIVSMGIPLQFEFDGTPQPEPREFAQLRNLTIETLNLALAPDQAVVWGNLARESSSQDRLQARFSVDWRQHSSGTYSASDLHLSLSGGPFPSGVKVKTFGEVGYSGAVPKRATPDDEAQLPWQKVAERVGGLECKVWCALNPERPENLDPLKPDQLPRYLCGAPRPGDGRFDNRCY